MEQWKHNICAPLFSLLLTCPRKLRARKNLGVYSSMFCTVTGSVRVFIITRMHDAGCFVLIVFCWWSSMRAIQFLFF